MSAIRVFYLFAAIFMVVLICADRIHCQSDDYEDHARPEDNKNNDYDDSPKQSSTSRQLTSIESYLSDRFKEKASDQAAGSTSSPSSEETPAEAGGDSNKFEKSIEGETTKGRNLQHLYPPANNRYTYNNKPAVIYSAARPSQMMAVKTKPNLLNYRPPTKMYQPPKPVARLRPPTINNYHQQRPAVAVGAYKQHVGPITQPNPQAVYAAEPKPTQYYAVPIVVTIDHPPAGADYASDQNKAKDWPRLDYSKLVKGYYLEGEDDHLDMEPEDSEYESPLDYLAETNYKDRTTVKPTAKVVVALKKEKNKEGHEKKKKKAEEDKHEHKHKLEDEKEVSLEEIQNQSDLIEQAFAGQDLIQHGDEAVELIDIRKPKEITKKPSEGKNSNKSHRARASSRFGPMPTARVDLKASEDELARDPARLAGEKLIRKRR